MEDFADSFNVVYNKSNQVIVKNPGSINNVDFSIQNVSDCDISVFDNTVQVIIENCNNSRILIGPCEGSVFIRNCTNCVFRVISKQFRTRDCTKCSIFLYCPTDPVIERSSELQFGVWNVAYPLLNAQVARAKMDPQENDNKYLNIYDFTPDEKVTHWTEIPIEECDLAMETIPLRDEQTGAPLGPPENPVPLKKVEKLVKRFDEINKRRNSFLSGQALSDDPVQRKFNSDNSNSTQSSAFNREVDSQEAFPATNDLLGFENDQVSFEATRASDEWFQEPQAAVRTTDFFSGEIEPKASQYTQPLDESSPFLIKQREIMQRIEAADSQESDDRLNKADAARKYKEKLLAERRAAIEQKRSSHKLNEQIFFQDNSFEPTNDQKLLWKRVWNIVEQTEQSKKKAASKIEDDFDDEILKHVTINNNDQTTGKSKNKKQVEPEPEVRDVQRFRQLLIRLKQ